MKKASIIIVQLFCLVVFLSFTADAQSNCTYTVNPNSFVVPVSGGNYSLDITTQDGCPWTVIPFQSTRPPSISFTSPTSGTGSGKVDFTIAPNTSPSIREGGIAVKSPDFSTRAEGVIVQDVQCGDPMFGPSVVNVPGEGSTELSFGWSPSSVNCSYITVRSNDSWITLTGTAPESRYTFSVAPNTGSARTGTISIIINTRVNTYQKIGTLTVNQAAGQSNCTYTFNSTNNRFPSSGGNGTFDVVTQAGCTWTATTSDEWITITSGNSGTGNGTVNYSVGVNPSPNERFGSIKVNNQTFGISQNRSCSINASPSSISVPSEGGTGTVAIGTGSSSCFYSTVVSVPWIIITGGDAAAGNISYRVEANTGAARSGTITFRISSTEFATVTVNQAAGQSNCTYALNPTGIDIGHSGGSRSFNVITQEGCAWTASTNQPWITITGGASGTGNGTVTFTAASNFSDQQRAGIITVNNQVFTVSQNRHCFVPSGFTISVPSSGATGSHTLTTSCFYSYQSNDSWIISGGSQGGTSPITYTVQPNPGAARTGTITVRFSAEDSFLITINQAAGQSNCTYTLTRNYTTPLPKSGGNYSITVNTQEGCAWTVENNTPWIVITSGSSGTGSGTISFTLQPNTTETRSATMSVAGQSVSVLQSGGCNYTPTPASINVPSNGGQGSFTINLSEGCGNHLTIDYIHNPWINVVNTTRDGTLITFFYSVDENLGEARTGTIKFSDPFSPPGGIFTVNQAGQTNCTYTLSPAVPLEVPYNGGNYSLNIITQPGCQWTAQFSSSNTIRPVNLTFTSPTSGVGSGKVDFIIAPAPTSSSRAGRIILNGNYAIGVDIGQEGDCGVILLNPSSVNTLVEGGQGNFRLSLNSANCTANVQSNDSWITASGTNVPMGLIGYSVAPNSGAPRTGTISVTTVGALGLPQKTATFTVSQAGQTNCTYSINPTSIQAGVAGGDAGFNITTETGCNWTAQSNASWITVSNTTGSGAGRINYSIQSNTGAARQGTITAGGQTFTINQDAVAAPVELIRASGRVIDASFKSVRGAIVSFTNLATGETRTTTTNHFGYFHFANIERGQPYSIAISHKRYKFTTRTVIYNTGALIPIYNPDPEP
ncbi:MAG TPA: BACON domain-containing carbohydrate-binding protein [Pyrinomonadaceae bacterium]